MKYSKMLAMIAAVVLLTAFNAKEVTEDSGAATIVEIASANENLSTLVTALDAAGLVETLSSEGPFTVFAPTNEAFDALPEGKLEELLKPENKEKLKSILTYHVVAGKVLSSDLEDGQVVTTVEGSDVTFYIGDSGAMINEAAISDADIEASNGVVHLINKVIMPSEKMEVDYN